MRRSPSPAPEASAYLDIETSWAGQITVIGIYRPLRGTEQLVGRACSPETLRRALSGVERIVTYNGSRFDLPVIRRRLGVDLFRGFAHTDLMFHCWRHAA